MEYELKATTKTKSGLTFNLLVPIRSPEEQARRDKEADEGLVNLWIDIRKEELKQQNKLKKRA